MEALKLEEYLHTHIPLARAMQVHVIDASQGFYRGHAQLACRSVMNVTFRLPGEELEKKFLAEAANHWALAPEAAARLEAAIAAACARSGTETREPDVDPAVEMG